MKIVCDSCGAKYSIADEKVAGKVFKIRCKKCSNVIVVRGDQIGAPAQEEATRVFDYGTDAVWHVVVDGDQQGPFPAADVGALLSEGRIDWEAYVWREGFDGWKAARDVPDLVAELTGSAQASNQADAAASHDSAAPAAYAAHEHEAQGAQQQPAAAAYEAQPAAAAYEAQPAAASADPDPFGGSPDLFAGAAAPAAAHQSHAPFGAGEEEATRAVASPAMGMDAGAGADLFAPPAMANAGFGAPGGPGSEGFDVPDGADPLGAIGSPSPHAAASFSGQRNENSVLFSLNNLKALATGSSAEQGASTGLGQGAPSAAMSPMGAAPATGVPLSEGSGLIDIRALASVSTAAQGGPQPRNTADSLLSIGAGGPALGGALGSPLLAPVEESKSSNTTLWVVLAAVAVLAIAGVALAVLLPSEETAPVAVNTPVGMVGQPVPGPGTAQPPPAANPTGEEEVPTPDAGQQAATPTEEVPAVPDRELTPRELRIQEERRLALQKAREERIANRPSEAQDTSSREALMVTNTTMMTASSGDLDSFLNMALAGGMGSSMMAAPEMAASNLSQVPSRGQVASALRGVSGRVGRCGGGQGGTVNVRVTVSGRTGRVTNANVSGAPNGQVRSCVSAAVRGARFPRFQQATFAVTFPYRLN